MNRNDFIDGIEDIVHNEEKNTQDNNTKLNLIKIDESNINEILSCI